MTIALALMYFLGIFLHYVHIITISAFVRDGEGLDMKRVIGFSLVWPLMTCWYFWELVLKGDDEDV